MCCYLSRIRTELHYRQVLGRILRRTGEADNLAWLFMLAEPTLQQFAERIAEDLPDDLAVLNQIELPSLPSEKKHGTAGVSNDLDDVLKNDGAASAEGELINVHECNSAAFPHYNINFSHHYRQVLLSCF